MLFNKKALQVSVVNKKDIEPNTDAAPAEPVDYAKIAEIATEFTVKTVTAVGAVIAANKLLNTACEIAKIAAQAKLK
jgi:hypothetical protein